MIYFSGFFYFTDVPGRANDLSAILSQIES